MKKELSACAIQTFNGYELLRNHLNNGERQDYVPINIVYEPTLEHKKAYFFVFMLLLFILVFILLLKK